MFKFTDEIDLGVMNWIEFGTIYDTFLYHIYSFVDDTFGRKQTAISSHFNMMKKMSFGHLCKSS